MICSLSKLIPPRRENGITYQTLLQLTPSSPFPLQILKINWAHLSIELYLKSTQGWTWSLVLFWSALAMDPGRCEPRLQQQESQWIFVPEKLQVWTHTELSLGWAVVEACWLQWGIAQGPCKPWGIVEPSTVLSNLGATLAVTCFVTHYLKFCGLIQLPCIISHSFWGQRAKFVGQGTLGSVRLCFTMPGASARGLKAGELGSSKGSVMHMPGGWFWLKSYLGLLAVTFTQGLCSLGFLTTWWLGFRGEHRERESTRAPESTRQKLYPFDELTSTVI